MIGYSAYRISKVENVPSIYYIQLLLSFTWVFVYTRVGSAIAFIKLWFSIFLCIISFFEIDEKAAYLLLPYLLWTSYVIFLNNNTMMRYKINLFGKHLSP